MPSSLDVRTLAHLREHRPDLDDIPDDVLLKTFTFAHARVSVAFRDLLRSIRRGVRR